MFLIELAIVVTLGIFVHHKEPHGSVDEKAVEDYQRSEPTIDKFNIENQADKPMPISGSY